MQFMMSVIEEFLPGGVRADAAGSASPQEEEAIDAFNEKMRAAGQWVFAGGLDAPGTATVIDSRAGEPVVTSGPFLESKEHIGGFWIVEAPDLDAALALGAEGSVACNRRIEVRPFL